jgi:nucleoside triphosphate diphosphatase
MSAPGSDRQTLTGVLRLLDVMRRLRDPASGCSWDLAQDSRSLARYALEEAYEVVSAIESGSDTALRDELGDLLFQVVFHAQLGAERGVFDFNDVAEGIASKLLHRHPHVFGGGGTGDHRQWESIKAAERAGRGSTGVLDDVPSALPALIRATKLGKRAATVGFDWPDAAGPHAKVLEELAEVEAARNGAAGSTIEDEIGDLLLAVTSYSRHLKVDPETALRRANNRFEERFRAMESVARARGLELSKLGPAELDGLWEAVKKGVQS